MAPAASANLNRDKSYAFVDMRHAVYATLATRLWGTGLPFRHGATLRINRPKDFDSNDQYADCLFSLRTTTHCSSLYRYYCGNYIV